MNSKHKEHNPKVCNICDKEFFTSETLINHVDTTHGTSSENNRPKSGRLTCDKCGNKCNSKSKLQNNMNRYNFEITPCGSSLCNDMDGVGLGCVCHLCDLIEDSDLSEVCFDEERLAELKILANIIDDEG